MVNVLVIGATGYIGQATTSALVRSGSHRVFGLARTPEKGALLTTQEVIPIIGSIENGAIIQNAIHTHDINIVLDVSGALQGARDLLHLVKSVGQERLAKGHSTQKLGFIYTSGTWIHGSSNDPVNDLTPVGTLSSPTQPPKLLSWRPALEQEILAASDVLDTMIVRPALVYGRSSYIWSILFGPIAQAIQSSSSTASIPVIPISRPGLVHIDDVASGLNAAVNWLPLIAGRGLYPVFDLVTSQESMREILEAVAKHLGFEGKVELVGVGGSLFAEAMSTSFNGSSGRAKQILGWEPKKVGFVQGMDVFAKAWAAGLGGDAH